MHSKFNLDHTAEQLLEASESRDPEPILVDGETQDLTDLPMLVALGRRL